MINDDITPAIKDFTCENKYDANKQMDTKGSNCSKEGKKYELVVYNIVSNVKIKEKDIAFNTQKINELGGCTSNNDIVCNFNKEKDIGIEIKKMRTPDWMQCSIKYNTEKNEWLPSDKNRIPENSKKIFAEFIRTFKDKIFNGKIPPFFERQITHEEWKKIKSETCDFNDQYIDCPDNTIANLYFAKGCQYIQISDKGLYHLKTDECQFDVPLFSCSQKLRIRTKIHTRKNSSGYCSLSVTLSCMPKDIKKYEPSKYSLDNFNKIPLNLIKV